MGSVVFSLGILASRVGFFGCENSILRGFCAIPCEQKYDLCASQIG